MKQFVFNSAEQTAAFGAQLYAVLPEKCTIFLLGDLGAGKTTLVRGFIQAAGHKGAVKSPTYNIVEEYSLDGRNYFHFDLYRLVDPEELEWIGIDDYLQQHSVCFIEWPEKGGDIIGTADIVLSILPVEEGRMLEVQKAPANINWNHFD